MSAMDKLQKNDRNHLTYWEAGQRREISYAALYERVLDASKRVSFLKETHGLRTVGICRESDIHWMIIDLACIRVGILTIAVPERLPAEQARALFAEFSVDALFVSQNSGRLTASAAFDGPRYSLEGPCENCLTFDELPKASRESLGHVTGDYYSVCFSSGTQRSAKALRVPYFVPELQRNTYLANAVPKLLIWMPFTHFIQRILAFRALSLGYDLVLSSPSNAARHLYSERPSHMIGAPFFYEALARAIQQKLRRINLLRRLSFTIYRALNLNSLDRRTPLRRLFDRFVLSDIVATYGGKGDEFIWNGGPISIDALRILDSVGLQVLGAYGISELGAISTDTKNTFKLGSVGRPSRTTKISASGEILVQADEAIRDRSQISVDSENFIHTGDFGRFAGGNLYVEGRIDDIFVLKNGKNIRPAEIESALSAIPGVLRACAFTRDGSRVSAIVFLERNSTQVAQVARGIIDVNFQLETHEKIFDFAAVDPSRYSDGFTHSLKTKRSWLVANSLAFDFVNVSTAATIE